jgi:hypothetical protein
MAIQITEPTELNTEPRKPKTPWVLLLPLALFAGALWQSNREPDTPLGNMDMNGNPTRNAARNAVDNTVQGSTDGTKPDLQPERRTVFIPDDNGYLRQTTIQDPSPRSAPEGQQPYGPLVELLVDKYPEHFPAGTEVLDDGKVQGDVVTLNFNKAFEQPDFWQGSARTLTTVYSIVNTVSAYGTETNKSTPKVRFLVEGKPVDVLGELDVSEPLQPDTSLVKKG